MNKTEIMMTAKEFYKYLYGEDALKNFSNSSSIHIFGFTEAYAEHLKQGQLSPIDNVIPCFEFSGKATKYTQGIAVDTDGISLSNDIYPHKAYTLEEGIEYTVKLYKV